VTRSSSNLEKTDSLLIAGQKGSQKGVVYKQERTHFPLFFGKNAELIS